MPSTVAAEFPSLLQDTLKGKQRDLRRLTVTFSVGMTARLWKSDLCQCVCEGGVGAVLLRLSPEGADTGTPKAVQSRGQSQGPWRL